MAENSNEKGNEKGKEKEKLVLVDVNALVHRAYHAYPATLSVEGQQTNAVYGFSVLLLDVINKFNPDYLICCVDVGKAKERIKIYAEYKATRKPTEPDLVSQFPLVRDVIKAFDIPIFGMEGHEADDLIGTIAKDEDCDGKFEKIIVTGDRDIFQLVDEHTKVYMSGNAFSGSKLYDSEAVAKKMGFGPEYVVDYKALRGDPSDNIPGVAGIGEKGALELISKYGHLDNILANIENIESSRLKKALQNGTDAAILSRELATINTNVPITLDLEHAKFKKFNYNKVMQIFAKFRFSSLIKRIQKLDSEKNAPELDQMGIFGSLPAIAEEQKDVAEIKEVNYSILAEDEVKEVIKLIREQGYFAFDSETDSLVNMDCAVLGISLSLKEGEAYYLPLSSTNEDTIAELKALFEDSTIRKIGHNMKFDIHALNNLGIEVRGVYFDTMLAAYILQMGEGKVGLKELAFNNFGMQMMEYKELLKLAVTKGKLDSVPVESIATYAAADADATMRLYKLYEPKLEKYKASGNSGEWNQHRLFYEIEMPIVDVLLMMERKGIMLDIGYLQEFAQELDREIEELKRKIFDLAGVEFNLNSPKQLGEVLYTKLGLSSNKKTSTGAQSTNERVLRDLREDSPIIDLILSYREISKLRSTYTDNLIGQVNQTTRRIHTTYNQGVASTGRLSSTDPNLQNIPVASDLGNRIREGFVSEQGKIFVSFDYSQQELRILSSVSRDEQLMDAYKKERDIHALTASKLFDIPLEEVGKNERGVGKTVNFSVVYGISAFGLSDRLKIPRKQAQEFINTYFETYPQVRQYFTDLIGRAKEEGSVSTAYGRVRDASGLRSTNFRVRAAVEREIINFPIQGTAADMMKLAMLDVAEFVSKPEWEGFDMLLQVHDELLFEIPMPPDGEVDFADAESLWQWLTSDKKTKEFMDRVQKALMDASILDIPMKVGIKVGKSWGKLTEIA